MEDFATRFGRRRANNEEFSRLLDEIIAEAEDDTVSPWIPSRDKEFWEFQDRIYAAGLNKDIAEVPWLASLTQVDDLGPMGRAQFLSMDALEALKEMPEEAFAEGKRLWSQIAMDASIYRKVGVCKMLEASGYLEALPLLKRMAEDDSKYVQSAANWIIQELLKKTIPVNEAQH